MSQRIRLNQIKRKKKRINERRFTIFCAVFMTVLILTANAMTSVFASRAAESSIMYVSCGDTIWDIAEEISNGKTDTRRIVNEIMRLNSLETAEIISGQTLIVPVY